QVPSDPYNY
nr:Chain B, Vacuolar protein sorting-associated protein 27 [Saccharomyces cerevisiae]